MEPPKLHGTQYFPAVTSVLIGWDSTVWIRARTRAQGEVWIALDRDGALLGRVRIEDGARLLGAKENEIVVVGSGEDESSDNLTVRGLRWTFRDRVNDEPTGPRATSSRLCE